MEKAYARVDNAKVVRLQTKKIQLKLIQMDENEIINDFTMIITWLVNQVNVCGETITEQYVIAKILCSLTQRFDSVVVVNEESEDLLLVSKRSCKALLNRMSREWRKGMLIRQMRISLCKRALMRETRRRRESGS